jgi:hypothetical protein
MDKISFFKLYNISDDNLIQLDRYRDGCIHYYHEITDKVYSLKIRNNTWSINKHAQTLKSQQDNKIEQHTNIDLFYTFTKQFLDYQIIINNHTKHKFLVLTKKFIDDLFLNKVHSLSIRGNVSSFLCSRILAFSNDKNMEPLIGGVNCVYEYPTHTLRLFDYCWDFECDQQLYISLNNTSYKIYPGFILFSKPCYTNIKLSIMDGDKFITAPSFKFKGIHINSHILQTNTISRNGTKLIYYFDGALTCVENI